MKKAEIKAKYDRIDVLINNAAAVYHKYGITEEGIERQFAVNHLGPFYLTSLLLNRIKKSGNGRIITVSSHSHYKATLDFDDIFMKNKYGGNQMYKRTKLCNVLFTYELARRLKQTWITVNCLHPGMVQTAIGGKHAGWFIKLAWWLIKLLKGAITVEYGAATSIFLAQSQEVKNITGKYFYRCKPKDSDPLSYDEDLAKKLWELSSKLCYPE